MTDSTPAPAPIERSVPFEEVLKRYRVRLADATERAIIAEATAAAAEAEAAQLRLQVVTLQEHATNDAEG